MRTSIFLSLALVASLFVVETTALKYELTALKDGWAVSQIKILKAEPIFKIFRYELHAGSDSRTASYTTQRFKDYNLTLKVTSEKTLMTLTDDKHKDIEIKPSRWEPNGPEVWYTFNYSERFYRCRQLVSKDIECKIEVEGIDQVVATLSEKKGIISRKEYSAIRTVDTLSNEESEFFVQVLSLLKLRKKFDTNAASPTDDTLAQ